MYLPRIAAITGMLLLLVTSLGLAAETPPAGNAATADPFTIVSEVPDILVFADGKMVPAAPIVRAIGGQMTYKKGQLAITLGETTLNCQVGKMTMEVARKREKTKIHLTLAPFELNGEIYIPLLSMVTALEGLATYNASIPGYGVSLGETVLHLREAPAKMKPADYREYEPQLYLAALDGSELTRLTFSTTPTGLPAISPAGDALVFSRFGALYLRKSNQAEAEVLLPANYDDGERTYSAPAFMPDGRAILFTKYEKNAGEEQGQETAGIVGLDGTGEKTLTDDKILPQMQNSGIMGTVLNTPRDSTIMLRGGTTQGITPGMTLFTIRRQTVTGVLSVTEVNPAETSTTVVWDAKGIAPGDKAVPSSTFFAFTMGDGKAVPFRTLLVHPMLGVISYAPLFPLEGDRAVLSPSGLTVAWTADMVKNPVVKVANLVTQDTKVLATGHSPVFSPDGKRIAFIDGNGSLMIMDADGKNSSTLQASWQGGLSHPAFTPDGTEVLFLKNGRLCAIKPGAGAQAARELTKGITVKDFTTCPDGKHLLLTAVPGTP